MVIFESDFFLQNLWWMILALTLAIGLIIVLVSALPKKKKKNEQGDTANEYLRAIGGLDNVIDHSLVGSRIVLRLKDYSLLDKEALKGKGAVGFLLKSDKLTLVFSSDAEKIYKKLFSEKPY